jgi:hypothetical protein
MPYGHLGKFIFEQKETKVTKVKEDSEREVLVLHSPGE